MAASEKEFFDVCGNYWVTHKTKRWGWAFMFVSSVGLTRQPRRQPGWLRRIRKLLSSGELLVEKRRVASGWESLTAVPFPMSYRGILDVVVHFESFRNVDLFLQGLYQLECRVYQELDGEVVAGIPFASFTAPADPSSPYAKWSSGPVREAFQSVPQLKQDNQNLLPARACCQSQSFTSRAFTIRRAEQLVELNDGVQFRIEVDLAKSLAANAPIYLEVDLLFAEWREDSHSVNSAALLAAEQNASMPNQSGNEEGTKGTENDLFTSRIQPPEFQSVSYQILRLNSPLFGVHDCVPVVFDQCHFCVANMLVHSCLIDTRFRGCAEVVKPIFSPRYNRRRPPPTLSPPSSPSSTTIARGRRMGASDSGGNTKLPDWVRPPGDFASYLLRAAEEVASEDTAGSEGSPATTAGESEDSVGEMVNPRVKSTCKPMQTRPCPPLAPLSGLSSSSGQLIEPDSSLLLSHYSGKTAEERMSTAADQLHMHFVKLAVHGYVRLAEVLAKVSSCCLNCHDRFRFGTAVAIPPLALPGGGFLAIPDYTTGSVSALPDDTEEEIMIQSPKASRYASTVGSEGSDSLPNVFSQSAVKAAAASTANTGKNVLTRADEFALSVGVPKYALEEFWSSHRGASGKDAPAGGVKFDPVNMVHLMSTAAAAEGERRKTTLSAPPSTGITGMALPVATGRKTNSCCRQDENPTRVVVRIPRVSSRLERVEGNSIVGIFSRDLSLLFGQIFELWYKLLNLLPFVSADLSTAMLASWQLKTYEKLSLCLHRETCGVDDVTLATEKALWETHEKEAEECRKKLQTASPPTAVTYGPPCPSDIQDRFFQLPAGFEPIVFEQRYVPSRLTLMDSQQVFRLPHPLPSAPKLYSGVHLFIFVHGYQGRSSDLRLFKNCLALLYPDSCFYLSTANENQTEGDIMKMGERLAEEVSKKVAEWFPGDSALGRISFIVHSLGGLIARAAFPHLEDLWPKFHCFISLSTPHLGYMHKFNRLIEAGLWVLKKWKNSTSLQQLTLGDAPDPEGSCLYTLSGADGFRYFRHVCLISSFQDQYAPFDSARIQLSPAAQADARLGKVYVKMAQRILEPISLNKIVRLDVAFSIPEKNVNTLIGRAAHIQFLECVPLMQMISHSYPVFFR